MFNSFVKSTTKALRQLLEALNAHILLSGDARRTRDDYLDMCISKSPDRALPPNPTQTLTCRPPVPERCQHGLWYPGKDVSRRGDVSLW